MCSEVWSEIWSEISYFLQYLYKKSYEVCCFILLGFLQNLWKTYDFIKRLGDFNSKIYNYINNNRILKFCLKVVIKYTVKQILIYPILALFLPLFLPLFLSTSIFLSTSLFLSLISDILKDILSSPLLMDLWHIINNPRGVVSEPTGGTGGPTPSGPNSDQDLIAAATGGNSGENAYIRHDDPAYQPNTEGEAHGQDRHHNDDFDPMNIRTEARDALESFEDKKRRLGYGHIKINKIFKALAEMSAEEARDMHDRCNQKLSEWDWNNKNVEPFLNSVGLTPTQISGLKAFIHNSEYFGNCRARDNKAYNILHKPLNAHMMNIVANCANYKSQ